MHIQVSRAYLWWGIGLIAVAVGAYFWLPKAAPVAVQSVPSVTPLETPSPSPTSTASASPEARAPFVAPTSDFLVRITKKKFGTYVTPTHSPIQPERFTGYHTGVDVEFTDVTADVPVYAVADGTVVYAQWTSGYGGLLALQVTVAGQNLFVLYGHVRSSTVPAVGTVVHQGEKIAVLGTGYSHETDGERHHLHLAVYAGATLNVRGYVATEAELSAWRNPLDYF